MARIIVVTSGKGGVGKTTVSANLSMALSARGKKVAAVEGDIGLNNLDVVLGVEDRIVYDAGEVALGKATVMQALVPISDNLYLFPATTGAANVVTTDVFLNIVRELAVGFDYVIIDSPAGIEENFHRAAIGAGEAIVVTTPHIPAVRDGVKTVKMLHTYGVEKVGLVLNRVRGELVADKQMLSPKEVSDVMQLPLLGILPEDDFVNLTGVADVRNKRTGIGYSFSLLAAYVDGGDKKLYDCVSEHKSVIGRLKRWLNV